MLRNMDELDIKPRKSMGEEKGELNSPVTNLAMNLSELRTDRSTPQRCLSRDFAGNGSILSGCFKDSPTPYYSPSDEYRTNEKNSCFLNKFSSLCDVKPLEILDSSLESSPHGFQAEQDDSNSRDSGFGNEKDKEDQFQFVPPLGMPPRKQKMFEENFESSFSRKFHRSMSAPLIKKEDIEFLQRGNSPKKPDVLSSEKDDGFSDHFESMDTAPEPVSDSIKSLIEAPLKSTENSRLCKLGESFDDTPTTTRIMKYCARSFDVKRRSVSIKRDLIKDENTPVHQKRRKPTHGKASPVFKRSHSATEAQIKAAVQKRTHNPSLIGDASKTYCLPTTAGKHEDLKSVTSHTVRELLDGHYNHEINTYSIIDCRYPYEYQGGHIVDAENLYDKDSIYKKFLANPPRDNFGKRDIVVFHCEFSSERAPKLARFLRNNDRSANANRYPFLYYPEIYILDGGYKAFYERCVEFCEPKTYKPMLHSDHSHELKHFRGKSKSWAGERTQRHLNF